MKKLLFSLLITVISLPLYAQEASTSQKENKQFVGCAMTIWNNSDADYSLFQITPKYGYHINSLLALGISFDYAYTDDGNTSNLYGINPFVRFKYLCKQRIAAPIVLFADLGVNYSVRKYKNTGMDDVVNAYVGLRPGIAYILSNRFSVAAYFGFIGYRYSDTPNGSNNGTGLSLTTNGLALGLNIHF